LPPSSSSDADIEHASLPSASSSSLVSPPLLLATFLSFLSFLPLLPFRPFFPLPPPQLQEELRAGEALRTFTCGLQRTKTYNELFDMNRTDGWDPAGYSSPRWCRTAKVSLKATGELPSSPAAALR
jgi:hypothetical protein